MSAVSRSSSVNESFSNSTYCELVDAAFHGCACSFAFLQQYCCCNDPHKGRRLRLLHLHLVYSFLLFPFLSKVGVVRQQPSTDLPRQLLSPFLDDSYTIRHLPCLCLRAGRHLMCPSPKCNCHLVHLCLNVDGCLLDMLSEVLCHSPRLLPCGPS